jgi:hypothetical protein
MQDLMFSQKWVLRVLSSGYNAVKSVEKANWRFRGTYRRGKNSLEAGGKQTTALTSISFSFYSSTLKMEVICSSEKSVDSQRATRRYIPEDSTLQLKGCWLNEQVLPLKFAVQLFTLIWGTKYKVKTYNFEPWQYISLPSSYQSSEVYLI